MTADQIRLDRLTRLFATARTLPAAQWATWLEANAADDPQLRAEVLRLLQQHSSAGLSTSIAAEIVSLDLDDPSIAVRGYRIIRELGSGGMGTVYLAEQLEPVRRDVAMKVIKRGMDSRAVIRRFDGERQTLAGMTCDQIARVFDAGLTDDGRPFFTMEYVDGVPLIAFCDIRRLPLAERIRLFQQVCEGVMHAHERGVVHRDLKPSNVLVPLDGEDPKIKIIDFGIARAVGGGPDSGSPATREGNWLGTPEYMSPEQARSAHDVDFRTDVYSLGVMLYELLTGELPLHSRGLRGLVDSDLRQRIADVEPAKPSTRVAEHGDPAAAAASRQVRPTSWSRALRGDLDWITMKALEKDPRRRYASPAELAADLERHLRHEPVTAGPPSPIYRLRKFVRRHRAAVASWSLLLVAAASWFAFASLRWRHEAERQQLATAARTRIEGGLTRIAATYAERPGDTRLLKRMVEEVDAALATARAEGADAAMVAGWEKQVAAWSRDLTLLTVADAIVFDLSFGSDRMRGRRRQQRIVSTLRDYGIELDGPGGEAWLQATSSTIRDSRVADWLLVLIIQARNVNPRTPSLEVPERCQQLLHSCLDGVRRDLLAGDFSDRPDEASRLLEHLAPTLRPLDAILLVPELRRRKLGGVADEVLRRLAGQPSPLAMCGLVNDAWTRFNRPPGDGSEKAPSAEEMSGLLTGLLSSNPDSRVGWVYRARMLAGRRDPDAVAACDAALEKFPGDPTTLYYLAGLQADKQPAVARTTLQQLLAVEPSHAQGYEMLAMLTPDAEERLLVQQRAVAADPWFADNVLPLARNLLGRDRPGEAAEVLVNLLVDTWRATGAYPLLADAAERLGDTERASLCCRALACVRGVATVPEYPALLLRTGDVKRARDTAVVGLLTADTPEQRERFVQLAADACRALGEPFDVVAARDPRSAAATAWSQRPAVAEAVARRDGRWIEALGDKEPRLWRDSVAERGERLDRASAVLARGLAEHDAALCAEAWSEVVALIGALQARAGHEATTFDSYLEVQVVQATEPIRVQLDLAGLAENRTAAEFSVVRDARRRLLDLRNACRERLLARFVQSGRGR